MAYHCPQHAFPGRRSRRRVFSELDCARTAGRCGKLADTAGSRGGAGPLAGFAASVLDAVGDSSGLSNVALWWRPVVATSGLSMLMFVAALALAALSLRTGGRGAKTKSLTAIGVARLAFALSGHAATASPGFLMRPLVFLHVAAVLFWSGSLPPLLLLTRRWLSGWSRCLNPSRGRSARPLSSWCRAD